MRRRFPYGFLIIISLIMVYLYICFVWLMIVDLSHWNKGVLITFLIIYHIIFILLLWSMISTIKTDPGKVPVRWVLCTFYVGIQYDGGGSQVLSYLPCIQAVTYTPLWHL